MRLYRVKTFTEGGISGTMSWHTSMRSAKDAAAHAHACEPEEDFPEIIYVDVVPTKAGIMSLLRRYASHADNG